MSEAASFRGYGLPTTPERSSGAAAGMELHAVQPLMVGAREVRRDPQELREYLRKLGSRYAGATIARDRPAQAAITAELLRARVAGELDDRDFSGNSPLATAFADGAAAGRRIARSEQSRGEVQQHEQGLWRGLQATYAAVNLLRNQFDKVLRHTNPTLRQVVGYNTKLDAYAKVDLVDILYHEGAKPAVEVLRLVQVKSSSATGNDAEIIRAHQELANRLLSGVELVEAGVETLQKARESFVGLVTAFGKLQRADTKLSLNAFAREAGLSVPQIAYALSNPTAAASFIRGCGMVGGNAAEGLAKQLVEWSSRQPPSIAMGSVPVQNVVSLTVRGSSVNQTVLKKPHGAALLTLG